MGRLIRRAQIVKIDGLTQLRNVYPGSEFVLGTDPLFRPVNLMLGPDGAIYIADRYHGIIQEAQWTPRGYTCARRSSSTSWTRSPTTAASGGGKQTRWILTIGDRMPDEVEFLKRLYDRFNARDMEKLLAAMQEEVIWANGMEGGHVHGREGVRSYWTRQWAMIDPHVEPVEFSKGPQGEIIVEVHQIVRDLNGTILTDKLVGHVFRLEKGLVQRFDIRST